MNTPVGNQDNLNGSFIDDYNGSQVYETISLSVLQMWICYYKYSHLWTCYMFLFLNPVSGA